MSGPEDKFGLSLIIAAIISVSVNLTVSRMLLTETISHTGV